MKKIIAIILGLIFLFNVAPANAYYTNMSASVVIGQPDFVSSSFNAGLGASTGSANSFLFPAGLEIIDSKLVVADSGNNRVLIWNRLPTENNVSANVVIGEPNFTATDINGPGGTLGANVLHNPEDVTSDGTRLIVPDWSNNRVLIWNTIPTQNGASADFVVGQPNMTTSSGGTTSSKFTQPIGTYYDPVTGKLFIAEYGNNRVLIYNRIPTSNSISADVVLGQADFTHGSANQGGSVGANTMNTPYSVKVFNGKLVVADKGNNRVLIWNSIPTTNNTPADVVVGQSNFTGNSINQGGTVGSNTLEAPRGIFFDGRRMYVMDTENGRILIYNSIPTTNNASADLVIGQLDFSGGIANRGGSASAQALNSPWGAALLNNRLVVADVGNNRVVIYNNILSTPAMNINSPTSVAGKIRIAGNVSLGERPNYSMQKVTASVNGEQESNVTYLDGGRDNGPGNTLYEFYNDFLPTVRGGDSSNYTVAFRAQSFNADEDKYFYFTPFSLDKITVENMPTISFTVNQTFRDQLKNNLVKYQIWYKKDLDKNWKLYLDNILTSQENSGKIVVKGTTKLLKGKYQIQIRAINIMNHEQQSNLLNLKLSK